MLMQVHKKIQIKLQIKSQLMLFLHLQVQCVQYFGLIYNYDIGISLMYCYNYVTCGTIKVIWLLLLLPSYSIFQFRTLNVKHFSEVNHVAGELTLTVTDCVVDGDGGLARFSQHGVHGHPQHQVKGLRSLKLRLTQVIQDGHPKRLHCHSGRKIEVATDSDVVESGCEDGRRNGE